MGRVEKLLVGRDNIVRAVKLVTLDKSNKIITLNRPLRNLYPLELSSCVDEKKHEDQESEPKITTIMDKDVAEHIV